MSISKYIKNHEELNGMDFVMVYDIIIALVEDGKIDIKAFDNVDRISK